MLTLLSAWEYTLAELGLAGGKDEPAPQPLPPSVVVTSERGGPMTMERQGRSDGMLMDDYRHAVFQRHMLVIAYSEISLQAA